MKRLNEVLLFSGGLDSFIAWHYLKKPACLYFVLNHRYSFVERERINVLCKETKDELRVIEIYNIKLEKIEEDNGNIPLRNLYLAAYATNYADNIHLVVQQGEKTMPDRSFEFLNLLNRTLRAGLGSSRIRVDTPFFNRTKTDMVRWYIDEGYDADILKNTWSCYEPLSDSSLDEIVPCGECSACFRRWVAMFLNKIEERYVVSPPEGRLVDGYIQAMRNGEYDSIRTKQTMMALRKYGRL